MGKPVADRLLLWMRLICSSRLPIFPLRNQCLDRQAQGWREKQRTTSLFHAVLPALPIASAATTSTRRGTRGRLALLGLPVRYLFEVGKHRQTLRLPLLDDVPKSLPQRIVVGVSYYVGTQTGLELRYLCPQPLLCRIIHCHPFNLCRRCALWDRALHAARSFAHVRAFQAAGFLNPMPFWWFLFLLGSALAGLPYLFATESINNLVCGVFLRVFESR